MSEDTERKRRTDNCLHRNSAQYYTTNIACYESYITRVPEMKEPSKFDTVLKDYEVKEVVGDGGYNGIFIN